MPSFDIVSQIEKHELANAVDQANREVSTRFDFKGSNANYELSDDQITLRTTSDFQLKQMVDVLQSKLIKRDIDIRAFEYEKPEVSLHEARQLVKIKQGIDTALAKKISKLIKDSKLKVQTSIQGEQVRVTGKKRDDLQSVMTMLREEEMELPLQFENFRD